MQAAEALAGLVHRVAGMHHAAVHRQVLLQQAAASRRCWRAAFWRFVVMGIASFMVAPGGEWTQA